MSEIVKMEFEIPEPMQPEQVSKTASSAGANVPKPIYVLIENFGMTLQDLEKDIIEPLIYEVLLKDGQSTTGTAQNWFQIHSMHAPHYVIQLDPSLEQMVAKLDKMLTKDNHWAKSVQRVDGVEAGSKLSGDTSPSSLV